MEEIRILLIGRSGDGKSSVGNTLLGVEATDKNAFPVGHETTSCTFKCDYRETIRDNVRLVVVDTPGIFDTRVPIKDLQKNLIKALLFTTPGFHVIAFVLRPTRFTKEMQQTQQLFFQWFGGNVRNYACMIVTHCSSDDDLLQFIRNPHSSMQALMEACGGTVLPFENKHAPADIKEKQVRRFLQHVTHIQNSNGGQCFSNLVFNIAKEYARNRNLQTITNESFVLLNDAGIKFKYDSFRSLQIVEENEAPKPVQIFEENEAPKPVQIFEENEAPKPVQIFEENEAPQPVQIFEEKEAPKVGNLNIIYEDDSMSTGANSGSTKTSQCTPVQTFAANTGEFSETSGASIAVKPTKTSTRTGRVFVHASDADASTSGGVSSNDASATGMRQPRSSRNSTTVAGNQSTRLSSSLDEPSAGSDRSAHSRYDQTTASSSTPLNQSYASPATSLNQYSASPATSFNQHSASSATSGNSRLYQPSDGSMGRDNFNNTSDTFPELRRDMQNDDNVDTFMKGLKWIWGKIKDMCRKIRNFFPSDNYERA